MVDIVRFVGVLDVHRNTWVATAVKVDGLENVYRFAAKLRQGFKCIFGSL